MAIARGTPHGAPVPGVPRAREPQVKTSLTCSSLHLLKRKSLLKTRGGSGQPWEFRRPKSQVMTASLDAKPG
jgi:hypothetical protein